MSGWRRTLSSVWTYLNAFLSRATWRGFGKDLASLTAANDRHQRKFAGHETARGRKDASLGAACGSARGQSCSPAEDRRRRVCRRAAGKSGGSARPCKHDRCKRARTPVDNPRGVQLLTRVSQAEAMALKMRPFARMSAQLPDQVASTSVQETADTHKELFEEYSTDRVRGVRARRGGRLDWGDGVREPSRGAG